MTSLAFAVGVLLHSGARLVDRLLVLGPSGLPWNAYPERPMPERDAEWYRKVWKGAGVG